MARTIGNPLSWTARQLGATGSHLAAATEELGGENIAPPDARTLSFTDIDAALRKGWEDFLASRADAIFAVLIYPVIGISLVAIGFQMDLLPLLFPIAAGFALIGPVAAVGLYEISRRRERGEDVSWLDAFGVIQSPGFGRILVLGLYLAALYAIWMYAANLIYALTLGPEPPVSASTFLGDVFTTGAGWAMIVAGMLVGFIFALVALAVSVVSFPLLLDRRIGLAQAVVASYEVLRKNPVVILAWGAIVAAALVLGSIPLFFGLIVVMPVLGHATWHLYRRAVEPS